MLQEIDAVIFDLDGTLIDSMWMWTDIDIEYLERFGIPMPENLAADIEGKSFTETARYFKEVLHIPLSVEEIKQDWTRMAIAKYECQVPLKPGAGRFLDYLKERHIKMGIATSNAIELARAALEGNHMTKYFDVVLTGCAVPRGKPSPDIYLKAAEELGADPGRCLVFEDIPNGITAGKSAGMKVCAVEDDFSGHQQSVKRKLADYYIQTYDDIFEKTYEVLHE